MSENVSEKMLLCALKRIGVPSTVSDIADFWNGLVISEKLPRPLAIASIPAAHGLMKAMLGRGLVTKYGTTRENSRDVPVWAPVPGFDPRAPIPDFKKEAIANTREELEQMSEEQRFTLFDTMRFLLDRSFGHQMAIAATFREHADQWDSDIEKARRRLVEAGLAEKIGI